ncbi:MAG: FG-GAP-like repeat-containing protein [Candidatus Nanoarchaeia archaeon]
MKTKRLSMLSLVVGVAILAGIAANAQTDYTWAPGDAGGDWDTSTANWNPGPVAWPNNTEPGDNAIFGATTATRTVTIPDGTTINVNKIKFSSLSGDWNEAWNFANSGALNFIGEALIDPYDGTKAIRINAAITGSAGLVLDSSGSRNANAETRLGGTATTNTYTGITKVNDSTLVLYKNSALGATGEGNHTEIYSNGRVMIGGQSGTSTPLTIPEDIYIKAGGLGACIRSSNASNTLTGNVVYAFDANDSGINVNTAHTFTVSGNITLADGMTATRRISLSASGATSAKLVVSGIISDATDGKALRLLIEGDNSNPANSGTVELSGNNTFTGDSNCCIIIRRGTLLLSHENAEGSSTINPIILGDGGTSGSGCILRLLTNGAYTVNNPVNINTGTVAYTAVIGGNSAHESTYIRAITINDTNAGTYQLTAAEGGTVTFNGTINDGTQTKAISKIGAGTVVLNKSTGNTYDGGTTITAGTLVAANTSGSATGTGNVTVNNTGTLQLNSGSIVSGSVTVDIGGALTGSGKINGSTVTVNGNVAPNGTLTLGNATPTLTFGNGANVNFDLGTTSDKIAFTNTGSLDGSGNANLNLTLGEGFSYSNTYTIFENVSTEGFTFASITGYDNVNYTANFAKVGNNYVLSFTSNKFSVTYYGNGNNGGTAPVDPNSPYSVGAEVTVLDKGTLVKTNYTFSGWNTEAGGGGTSYNPGNKFNMPDHDVNLYAQWTENPKYTITFVTDGTPGASITGDTTQQVYQGQNCTPVTAVAPAGYAFTGWTWPGGGSSSANPFTATNIQTDREYTAHFELIVIGKKWDFNGDGMSDVLASDSSNNNGVMFLMEGTTPKDSGTVYTMTDTNWQLLGFKDFDGNGKADMIWQHSVNKKVVIYIMNGLTITSVKTIYNGTSGWVIDRLADFNGDGRCDILWKHPTSGGAAIWLMNGTDTVATSGLANSIYLSWLTLGTGDFNGDGKDDILWEKTSGSPRKGVIYLMNGTSISGTGVAYSKSSLSWTVTNLLDYNADGKCDMLWKNTATNSGAIYIMNGTTITGSGIIYSNSTAWQVVQSGDFNADNKNDLFWIKPATGETYIWLMNGTAMQDSGSPFTYSGNWVVKQLLDFNNDGKADVLMQNNDTNQAVDYLINDKALLNSGTVFGAGTKSVLVPLIQD